MVEIKIPPRVRSFGGRAVIFHICLVLFVFFGFIEQVHAASLSVSPSAGAFAAGSTFDVSLFLDTQGKAINALEIGLKFPADKLQLVEPKASQSIISVWTAQPKFNNQTGTIDLLGGVPGGINISKGLITTLTFRVKAVGSAILKFQDNTKVLLDDGLGTDDLKQTHNGVYELVLPPPAGPVVVSETHSNQSQWYLNKSVILKWAHESNVQNYSYILNKEPTDVPDDTSEGNRSEVIYKNQSDGTHYFHIKALRAGAWGETTHFAINIDSTSPAEFPITITPHAKTTRRQPAIEFETTDALSGLDHYELKLVPLQKVSANSDDSEQPFFIEAQSPFITPFLELGKYDVIIRAYDKAGNYREVTQPLKITLSLISFIDDKGLAIRGYLVIPWPGVWIGGILALFGLFILGRKVHLWHDWVALQHLKQELPDHINKKLAKLKNYQAKYSRVILFIALMGSLLLGGTSTLAQTAGLGPPLISTVSRNISNAEIFYVGGKTEASNSEVVMYLQNLQTGETISKTVSSDKRGDWFYRHDGFLSSGNYLLWAQTKLGNEVSPPSPQVQLIVRTTAIQFGTSRISFETLYLITTIIFALAFLGLLSYVLFHIYHGRRKHHRLKSEVREAEESIRRGFAILRRDLETELALIRKTKSDKSLSSEEKLKEEQLRKDLDDIETYVGKEIWEIQHPETTD